MIWAMPHLGERRSASHPRVDQQPQVSTPHRSPLSLGTDGATFASSNVLEEAGYLGIGQHGKSTDFDECRMSSTRVRSSGARRLPVSRMARGQLTACGSP